MEVFHYEEDQIYNQEADRKLEWIQEEQQLDNCIKIIQSNINNYTEKLMEISAETKELYDNYRSNNPELHNDLVIGLDLKSLIERTLNKNQLALKKPYFGRIDYKELNEKKELCLYIGKNGITKDRSEIVIVDWRAPISSVYYDSDVGESSYKSPMGYDISINLNLKRTYEIENNKLIDYYDSDVISNDEFLTKYLGKNKEVVLGEIIATIQKEQNQIIRDTPWHSIIVQGVAGSGKTTVAMHRISYLLYNYKEKLRADEIYIIGSNKMLLNYITGVLPNLDVYNINQMTMYDLFLFLLDKDFNIEKGKYVRSEYFAKLHQGVRTEKERSVNRFKSSIDFVRALELFLNDYELNSIVMEDVIYQDHIIFSKDEILYFLKMFPDKPFQEKVDLLNKRLANKISNHNEMDHQENEVIRREIKKYKNYFGNPKGKINLMEVYHKFLINFKGNNEVYYNRQIVIPNLEIVDQVLNDLLSKTIDLYDLSALAYIKRRLLRTDAFEFVSHIIVDEAQDFGVMVFYVLKQLFKQCTYTIMGDITQNINYDTGMNDWETLKEEVFQMQQDKFYVLAKSYRNTVEISNYASNVLKHCTFQTYDIEPIVRHGMEINVIQKGNVEEMVSSVVTIVGDIKSRGYDTIAIICRTVEETFQVYELLKPLLPVEQLNENLENMIFQQGIMILPIHMTKGLEFDGVILWNPDEVNYQMEDGDAKLLYVAITRALHELHVVYKGKLSKLLLD